MSPEASGDAVPRKARGKRPRRDSDTPYFERPSARSTIEASSRPQRQTRKTTRYADASGSEEETTAMQMRRLSASTASSTASVPKTPPQSQLGGFTPHIVTSSPESGSAQRLSEELETAQNAAYTQKDATEIGGKQKGKAKLELDGLGLESLVDDPITRWTRAFSLQPTHERAARLILEHLMRDETFAFLQSDERLRAASAFSLALLLLQWHPGPIKFTTRTGINFADVDWSRRMLLAHESVFRNLLEDAGISTGASSRQAGGDVGR